MTVALQESIAWARQGSMETAQESAVQLLLDEPGNAQGWYLLSQLVDSEARRALYLHRTLELDPLHERAWAEFYSLPLSLTDTLQTSDPIARATGVPLAAAAAVKAEETLPEWLVPLAGDQPVATTRTRTQESYSVTAAGNAIDSDPDLTDSDEGNRGLSLLLMVLVIATVFVLGFLAYLLLTA